MKKTIFLSIAIFFADLLQGQQLLSKERQEIQQTVVKMFQALSNRDSIALKYYCSPDVTFYEYGQISKTAFAKFSMIKKSINSFNYSDQ